ncbi:MAG: hypothetical protein US41_C0032G0013 [Parcubacteria group bacterium GW2011_GWB1_37_13]|uniref:Uncharacterized protein n=1 Tax=Candidatus Yanofskybacteria bacterium GW2011_GWC2_37_9 TaxID=1619028 RepID=A0A0G0HY15_9BACT|nr:MAG: hypothetical protein US41_C0032G0013 [Parcubacteria group bacterium GW2011_GWB1_37_13]KKQ48033.1 MAG: hypothetical protein US65_C0001G0014 [Candidatus Yanofskybacteria bacterium GW2011_GWC2_37_9]
MSDLDFIKDKELRSTLENSIEYIYALFEESKNGKKFINKNWRIWRN